MAVLNDYRISPASSVTSLSAAAATDVKRRFHCKYMIGPVDTGRWGTGVELEVEANTATVRATSC